MLTAETIDRILRFEHTVAAELRFPLPPPPPDGS